MKTQILQLEPHDDVISTRDKMGWGQAARVVLVWPKNERILVRKLDLLLLHRHAIKMGAQLALVTEDPDVRFHARQLAIPVFKNQRQAHSPRWRAGRRPARSIERRRPRPDLAALRQEIYSGETNWYNRPIARQSLHAVSILALLALLSLIIPAARITLMPQTQTQEIRFTVSARPSVRTVNLTGDVPAQTRYVVVEGRDRMAASGSLMVQEKSSFGRVEFTNLTGQTVTIPVGTVVTTLPTDGSERLRFATTVPLDVPVGGSVMISVRSLDAGKRGNVGKGEIVAIEGPLGLKLEVNNPSATTGGSEQPAATPTLEDAQKLYERLYEVLQANALRELGSERQGPADLPVDSSLRLAAVLEETYDPPMKEGAFTQTAETLELTLRLEFEALVISHQDLHNLATLILDANLPEGYQPVPETVEFENLTSPLLDRQSTARWRVEARRTIKAVIEEQQVLELVQGLAPIQAAQALQAELPLNGEVYIQLAPEWWPRLPLLPFRIDVYNP
jgi:hypothetical protein